MKLSDKEKEREEEILDLVIKSYIAKSKPISSSYLCDKYYLSYSSATIRHVMEALEAKGFLSHIHTSSGRIPTERGFKHYVKQLKEEDIAQEVSLPSYFSAVSNINEVINFALDTLARMSRYASLVAISSNSSSLIEKEKFFFRGTRFILEQPEFENITRLKNLFYTLEVKMKKLQKLLFSYLDGSIKILVGNETGFEEISDCSLIISGSKEKKLSFALALLGPMRMDYIRASSCLYSVKKRFKEIIDELI